MLDTTPQSHTAGVPVASTSPPASDHRPQRRAGSSIVPCPGFPCGASGAVDPLPRFAPSRSVWGFPRASTSLFRHATACGLRRTCPTWPNRWRAWCLRERENPRRPPWPCRSGTRTSGCAVTPTASRMLCRRFAHLVRQGRDPDAAMDARLDTGGWLVLPRQGLSPCKRRQASLGARTPGLSCGRKWERRRSGRWRQSAAAQC